MNLRRLDSNLVNEDDVEYRAAKVRAEAARLQAEDRSKLEELLYRVTILEQRTLAQEQEIKELKHAILSNSSNN